MGKLFELIKNNKKKILLFILLYIAFMFLLFPFGDLAGFVTTQVARQTGNQVYLKFDDMSLSLVPTPGFSFSNVLVRTVQFPELRCEKLKIAPSIAGLLSFRPGVSVDAEGFLGGNLSLSTRGTSKTKAGVLKQNISVSTDGLDLSKMASQLNLPMSLDGKLNLDAGGVVDPTFGEQPQFQVDVNAVRVNITSANIPTPIGPLNLPDTKLQELILKGQLNNGELNIEKAQIGSQQDELFAQIRGTMELKFQNFGGQVSASPGNFDLTVHIKTKPSYQAKAGLFLSFLDSYKKSEGPQGTEYLFKMSGNNFYGPPRMSPANSF